MKIIKNKGFTFTEMSKEGYYELFYNKEKSVTFKFNGIRVIMFNDNY